MSTEPVILTGDVKDVLPTLADDSVDAIVALVPVNAVTPRPRRQHLTFVKIKPDDLDRIVPHLLRVSRGPVALVVVEQAEAWIEAFDRHGVTARRQGQDHDVVDLIVASKTGGPLTLPPETTQPVQPLIRSVLDTFTEPDDTVLVPFANVPVVPLTVHSAGRKLVTIVPKTTFVRALKNTINADGSGIRLNESERAEALRRVLAGETATAVARSLGITDTAVHRMVREARTAA